MQCYRILALMTQPNSKLARLLPQRTHATLGKLRNFSDRRPCARNSFMSAFVYSRRTMAFFFAFFATYFFLDL